MNTVGPSSGPAIGGALAAEKKVQHSRFKQSAGILQVSSGMVLPDVLTVPFAFIARPQESQQHLMDIEITVWLAGCLFGGGRGSCQSTQKFRQRGSKHFLFGAVKLEFPRTSHLSAVGLFGFTNYLVKGPARSKKGEAMFDVRSDR